MNVTQSVVPGGGWAATSTSTTSSSSSSSSSSRSSSSSSSRSSRSSRGSRRRSGSRSSSSSSSGSKSRSGSRRIVVAALSDHDSHISSGSTGAGGYYKAFSQTREPGWAHSMLVIRAVSATAFLTLCCQAFPNRTLCVR